MSVEVAPDELVFLRAGPIAPDSEERDAKENARFRETFESIAPRLDPELAWSIADHAMTCVGDGDVGARTRFAVRRVALLRWAERVGEDALPHALGALPEDTETGLEALRAIAAHPETRRDRVLDAMRPYVQHSALVRHPALAAAALRAIAPEATPESLRVPKPIAAAWNDAALTEESIALALIALGVISTAGDIAPRTATRRPIGRELVIDVLTRAHVLAAFDTESGVAPVPYRELIEETLAPLARELAPLGVRVVVEPIAGTTSFAYAISLRARDVEVDARIDDAGDGYDVDRVLALFDALLVRVGASSRMHRVTTDDQTAMIVCAPPRAAKAIAKQFRLRLSKRAMGVAITAS